jgi:hypothetical protein
MLSSSSQLWINLVFDNVVTASIITVLHYFRVGMVLDAFDSGDDYEDYQSYWFIGTMCLWAIITILYGITLVMRIFVWITNEDVIAIGSSSYPLVTCKQLLLASHIFIQIVMVCCCVMLSITVLYTIPTYNVMTSIIIVIFLLMSCYLLYYFVSLPLSFARLPVFLVIISGTLCS